MSLFTQVVIDTYDAVCYKYRTMIQCVILDKIAKLLCFENVFAKQLPG
jgi:hypothetical protein